MKSRQDCNRRLCRISLATKADLPTLNLDTPASLYCKIMKSVHLIHFWVHAMSDTGVSPAAHQCQAPQKKLFQAINCSWQAVCARPVLVAHGCSTYPFDSLSMYTHISKPCPEMHWSTHFCLVEGPMKLHNNVVSLFKTSGLAHRIIDDAETKMHEAQPNYIVPTDSWLFMTHWIWQLLRPKGLEITPSNDVHWIAVVELLLSYPFQTCQTALYIYIYYYIQSWMFRQVCRGEEGAIFLDYSSGLFRFGREGPEQAHFNLDCPPCGPGTAMCRGLYMARSEAQRIRNRDA